MFYNILHLNKFNEILGYTVDRYKIQDTKWFIRLTLIQYLSKPEYKYMHLQKFTLFISHIPLGLVRQMQIVEDVLVYQLFIKMFFFSRL